MNMAKKVSNYIVVVGSTMVFLTGCATTGPLHGGKAHYINEDKAGTSTPTTLGLDYKDFRKASMDAVQSMLKSGALNKRGGGRYVLAISDIVNDTTQRIDIDQLVKSIRIALLQSGKVVVTTAVRAGGPEDKMSFSARQLRKSSEFNQKTVAKKGQMIAPDFSLSGKIIERKNPLGNGQVKVDYYFQLTLTDIKSGLAYWEGETVVQKAGSSKTVNW